MGKIEFDEAAADAVIHAATDAEDELRAQASARRSAVEDAADEFTGAYAERFTESASTESTDRARLSSVLNDLIIQMNEAKAAAAAENERLDALDTWKEREAAHRREEAMSLVAGGSLPSYTILAPKPSDVPVPRPSVHASFSPRERTRTGGGTGRGRSSADPVQLRKFAVTSRASDSAAEAKAKALAKSWTAFTSSSTWVAVDGCTFVNGFERFLAENRADAAWIDRVADAFERAGGDGSLLNKAIDRVNDDELVRDLRRLLKEGAGAAEIAAIWPDLGLTREDATDIALFPTSVLRALGNLEGAPYWARSAANIEMLNRRIDSATKFLDDLSRPDRIYDAEARKDAADLPALESIKAAITNNDRKGKRSLISLTADHPPLAAVSIGDLDQASNVTWAVPGMGSSTGKMTDWSDAAQNVYDQQGRATIGRHDDGRAVVAWMGYKAPPKPPASGEVFGTDYAEDGGAKLAASIKGLDAVRRNNMPKVNILAHSYGTTTASYALTTPGVHVDSFTAIASAGIPDRIHGAQGLHADVVYAGQAQVVKPIIEHWSGDEWAAVGRDLSSGHTQDPTDPDFGATTFGADGAPGLNGVRDHAVHTWYGGGYLDRNTESLQNIGFATTGQPGRLIK
jgi:hypothetical protein